MCQQGRRVYCEPFQKQGLSAGAEVEILSEGGFSSGEAVTGKKVQNEFELARFGSTRRILGRLFFMHGQQKDVWSGRGYFGVSFMHG